MLRIVVVDRSAESRNRLVSRISDVLEQAALQSEFVPRISIRPLGLEELTLNDSPDICVVGEEIVTNELTDIASVRAKLPNSSIVVCTNKPLTHLATIEQLARLGADDLMSVDVESEELIKRMILLARKKRHERRGLLVMVSSGKGGLGVTSIVAGLGEALASRGKKVVLVDFDTQTQDLSRFLLVRPYINENLQLLFSRSRPVTFEFLSECLVPLWPESSNFYCMPPLPDSDDLYEGSQNHSRTLLSILELLDEQFDVVLVDCGDLRGAMHRSLARVSDHLLYIVGNDPASLFASVDQLNRLRAASDPEARLLVVQNAPERRGLQNRLLIEEFSRAARLKPEEFLTTAIPCCPVGHRWPGSGATIYSLASTALSTALDRVLKAASLDSGAVLADTTKPSVVGWVRAFFKRMRKANPTQDLQRETNQLIARIAELPEPTVLMSLSGMKV